MPNLVKSRGYLATKNRFFLNLILLSTSQGITLDWIIY